MTQSINEEEYAKKLQSFEVYAELSKKESELQAENNYIRAYVFSFIFFPLGFYYFIKYMFFSRGTYQDKKAAVISLVITLFLIVLSLWSINALLQQFHMNTTGGSSILQEFITPENQKQFKNLLQ